MKTEVKVTVQKDKIIVDGNGNKLLAILATAFVFAPQVPDDVLLGKLGSKKLSLPTNTVFRLKIDDALVELETEVREEYVGDLIAAVVADIVTPEKFRALFYETRALLTKVFKREWQDTAERLVIINALIEILAMDMKGR